MCVLISLAWHAHVRMGWMDEIDPRGSRALVIGYPEKRAAAFSFFLGAVPRRFTRGDIQDMHWLIGRGASVGDRIASSAWDGDGKRKYRTDTGREIRRGACMLWKMRSFFFDRGMDELFCLRLHQAGLQES